MARSIHRKNKLKKALIGTVKRAQDGRREEDGNSASSWWRYATRNQSNNISPCDVRVWTRRCGRVMLVALVGICPFYWDMLWKSTRTLQQSLMMTTTLQQTLMMTAKAADKVGGIQIELDSNATLFKDLISIQHFPQSAQIVVELRNGAKCPRPYLMARLSGPALILLQNWTWSDNQKTGPGTTMAATYQTPIGGEYFLEVAALFCHDAFYDMVDLNNIAKLPRNQDWLKDDNKTADGMANVLAINFTGTCMENPFRRRLTAPKASIWVTPEMAKRTRQQFQSQQWAGYWHNHKSLPSSISSNDTTTTLHPPVYLRHQPFECYWSLMTGKAQADHCFVADNRNQFNPYEFRWTKVPTDSNNRNSNPLLPATTTTTKDLSLSLLKQSAPQIVCFVGFSHSKELMEAGERLGINPNTTNIELKWVQAKFPNDFKAKDVIQSQCTHLIVAIGQWPASCYYHGKPTLLDEYYPQMQGVFQQLVDAGISTSKVFARPIHYNGPSGQISGACPPRDWRSPMVLDAYNGIVQRVCLEYNVTYLVDHFVHTPIWDSNPDWTHLLPRTSEANVFYLIAAAMGMGNH
ncbi:expressed unknown protein [Seminavis robusta]|uniref:Uncharacterized protein n=1 Tax=Seminavis robusta TaxID=568900 RepID=A0A9N8DJJ5_9STRA|nr:expressed unknown protein [Seminavis robusta]|eukprot:Sro176_g077540.1 n/a (577) ;mRNA; f:86598-88328